MTQVPFTSGFISIKSSVTILALGWPIELSGVKKLLLASRGVIIRSSTIVNLPIPGRTKFFKASTPTGSHPNSNKLHFARASYP